MDESVVTKAISEAANLSKDLLSSMEEETNMVVLDSEEENDSVLQDMAQEGGSGAEMLEEQGSEILESRNNLGT